jgi:hypothetical protein
VFFLIDFDTSAMYIALLYSKSAFSGSFNFSILEVGEKKKKKKRLKKHFHFDGSVNPNYFAPFSSKIPAESLVPFSRNRSVALFIDSNNTA